MPGRWRRRGTAGLRREDEEEDAALLLWLLGPPTWMASLLVVGIGRFGRSALCAAKEV